jgi:nitrogen regulatory protein PII
MKMILMVYYVGLHNELMEVLNDLGVCTYTRWREVEGRISCGEPRDGSQVWPGTNSAVMVVVEDGLVDYVLGRLDAFNSGREGEGVDAYVLDVARAVRAGER